jgi:hypothetical protein
VGIVPSFAIEASLALVSSGTTMAGERKAGDDSTQRPFFERNAWAIFTGISLVVVAFGVGDIISGGSTYESGEAVLFDSLTGTTWTALRADDPGAANLIDYLVRAGGGQLLVVGLLSLVICLTGLRRGERWAWLAMWVWPLLAALVIPLLLGAARTPGAGVPVPVISGSILLVIAVATLLLSSRRYLLRA